MPATLTSEQIDDLLWCARSGVEIEDFEAFLAELVEADQDKQAARRELLNKALDGSGNSMLHYACANGHLGKYQCGDVTVREAQTDLLCTVMVHHPGARSVQLHSNTCFLHVPCLSCFIKTHQATHHYTGPA